MSGRSKFSVLRDPVHGDVYLSHEELRLVDTREFQRLRGIKQLGTANLVFPGAVHTRFDHSIGSLHVTQSIIDAVNLSFELNPAGLIGISEEEARVIRIAALVHDITHIPFGHNIEDQAGLAERHDAPARYAAIFSKETELGRVLDELGMAEDVRSILSYEGDGGAAVPPYWSEILSDTICSDIVDYLLRDAYFTGLSLTIDQRLVSYFKVDRASGNLFIDLTKHDLLREDILSEIVRMLEARYYFSERVYYHHAKVAAGALASTYRDRDLDVLNDPAANALMCEFLADKIRMRVKDPAVAERLIPKDHGFGTRRVPQETGYYEAFNRDNVRLVDINEDPIKEIFEGGVRTAGSDIDLDVLIYATGFDAITGAFERIDIEGLGGKKLRRLWRDGPVTYLGVLVADFPNMFICMGPHSGLGNYTRTAEYSVEWVSELIEHAIANKKNRVETTEEGMDEWTGHVMSLGEGLLMNEVGSWMTGVNRNLEDKQQPRIMRYSGGHPAYREFCNTVKEDGYRHIEFS